VLGFALARTSPTSPEGLESWPARALAFAGSREEDDAFDTLKGRAHDPVRSGESIDDVIKRSGMEPGRSRTERAAEAADQLFRETGTHRETEDRWCALVDRGEPVPPAAFEELGEECHRKLRAAMAFTATYTYELAWHLIWHVPEVEVHERALRAVLREAQEAVRGRGG
jgi:hypothetical protein